MIIVPNAVLMTKSKELRQAVIELEEALGILSTDTLMVKADRIRGIGTHDQGQLNWPIKGKSSRTKTPLIVELRLGLLLIKQNHPKSGV